MTEWLKFGFLPREGFENRRPEDICRELSRIGYRGVEWSRHHFKPREMSHSELHRLVNIPADFQMAVSAIFIALDYVSTDSAKRKDNILLTAECIEAAASIGVHTVNVSTGPQRWVPDHVRIPEEMHEGLAWDMVFAAFDELIPIAEKFRVYLAVEGVWGMLAHDYYTTLPLFQRYRSDYLAINMDPSHGTLYRNDIAWVIRQWGNRIRHCHLKDAAGLPGRDGDTFVFPLLGEGLVDWQAFFCSMASIRYQGFYSVEFESLQYLNRVLNGDIVAAARLSWKAIQQLTSTRYLSR
jgi:sugar phosphate isomerase/epimerase